jgi:hypothetical protein
MPHSAFFPLSALIFSSVLGSASASSSSSDRSSLSPAEKTALCHDQWDSVTWLEQSGRAHRKRILRMRKYQKRLMNWSSKIGMKICHFIL